MHCHISTVTHMLRPFNSAREAYWRSALRPHIPARGTGVLVRAAARSHLASSPRCARREQSGTGVLARGHKVFFIRSNRQRCRRGKKVSFLSPIRTVYSTVNRLDDNPAGRRTSPTPPIGERKIVRMLYWLYVLYVRTVHTVRTSYCTYFTVLYVLHSTVVRTYVRLRARRPRSWNRTSVRYSSSLVQCHIVYSILQK
jgi:hypothetical protein